MNKWSNEFVALEIMKIRTYVSEELLLTSPLLIAVLKSICEVIIPSWAIGDLEIDCCCCGCWCWGVEWLIGRVFSWFPVPIPTELAEVRGNVDTCAGWDGWAGVLCRVGCDVLTALGGSGSLPITDPEPEAIKEIIDWFFLSPFPFHYTHSLKQYSTFPSVVNIIFHLHKLQFIERHNKWWKFHIFGN